MTIYNNNKKNNNKMKKAIALIISMLSSSLTEAQTTNFYTNVTNLWYQGQKTEVLAIGQERLNINSNDMAGLLIQWSYDLEFLRLDYVSNSLSRIVQSGASITNTNFKANYPFLKESMEDMLEFFSTYHPTPTELAEEQAKGLISNKTFADFIILEALQKDGLCEPLTP